MVGGTFAAVNGCATCSNFDAWYSSSTGNGHRQHDGQQRRGGNVLRAERLGQLQQYADLCGSILGSASTTSATATFTTIDVTLYVAGHPMSGTFWKRY
jgi:hypothetical protein